MSDEHATAPPSPSGSGASAARPWYRKTRYVIPLALSALFALIGVTGDPAQEVAVAPTATASPATPTRTQTPTPTPTPRPTPTPTPTATATPTDEETVDEVTLAGTATCDDPAVEGMPTSSTVATLSGCLGPSVASGPKGPRSQPAPPGAVIVRPEDSLAAVARAHPEGTTFFLTAGHHVRDQASCKDRQRFIGAGPDTVLDGAGLPNGVWSAAHGCVVANMVVTGYSRNALVQAQATDWHLDRLLITRNAKGANLARGTWLTNSIVSHNMIMGVDGGNNAPNRPTRIANSEIAYNNPSRAEAGQHNSGAKFYHVDGHGLIVESSYFHHNGGHGLWLDADWRGPVVVRDSVFEANERTGLFFEAGGAGVSDPEPNDGALATGNQFIANTRATDPQRRDLGAGILVSNAANLTITGNALVGNANGVWVKHEQGATRPAGHDVPATFNVLVRGNTFVNTGLTGFQLNSPGDDCAYMTRASITFSDNTYRGSSETFGCADA